MSRARTAAAEQIGWKHKSSGQSPPQLLSFSQEQCCLASSLDTEEERRLPPKGIFAPRLTVWLVN